MGGPAAGGPDDAHARQRRVGWWVVAGGVALALLLALVVRPGAGEDAAVRVPRGTADAAELVLDLQAGDVRVEGGAPPGALLEARGSGEGRSATHDEADGTHDVRVTGAQGVVRLADDVAWTLRLTVGADDVRLDLADVGVADLRVAGGAGAVALTLPAPDGVPTTDLAVSADELTVRLPAGSGASVDVTAGAGSAVVDGERTDGVGAGTTLATADLDEPTHWALTLSGGVGTLTVERVG